MVRGRPLFGHLIAPQGIDPRSGSHGGVNRRNTAGYQCVEPPNPLRGGGTSGRQATLARSVKWETVRFVMDMPAAWMAILVLHHRGRVGATMGTPEGGLTSSLASPHTRDFRAGNPGADRVGFTDRVVLTPGGHGRSSTTARHQP